MEEYSIDTLTGNPDLDETEILNAQRDDAGVRPAALPDSPDLEREMAEAFGWDVPPTDEQMDRDYAVRQCDEQELVDRYPGLASKPDQFLIDLIATAPTDPGLGLMDDIDEAVAVAAILLERRFTADPSLVPLLRASLAYEEAQRARG